jgi:hypothetical protein
MSAFHEKCRYIAAELDKFIKNVDMDSYEVLLGQFDDEQKERIFGYDPNKELNLNEVSFVNDMEVIASLQKQAGLSDWWHNLTNERATAMRQLEKRFSISFLKDLKNNSINIFNDSQRFLQFLLTTFKKLATALARGKPSIYISIAKSFISKFDQYHKSFINFYEKNMKPLKQQHEKMVAEKKQAEEQAKTQQEQLAQESALKFQQENAGQQKPFSPPAGNKTNMPFDLNKVPISSKQNTLNKLDELNDPKDQEEDKKLPLIQSKQFISKIEKVASTNNAKSLMLAILKHSAELENTNPEASLKLLAIAEGISDDMNNAGLFDVFKNKKEEKKPEQKEENKPAPFSLTPPEPRKKPLEHGIPEGRINKKYTDFPVLSAIPADQIRITPNTSQHIVNIFIKKLYDIGINAENITDQNIITELKNAIPRGIILTSHKAEDNHNPLDRQLEIYSYMSLKNIEPSLNKIAKLKIHCRLSVSNGSLTIRTIDKNFSIE